MGKNLFSVPIFFIVFRETLEAAIIISVLLGLVEQIVQDDPNRLTNVVQTTAGDSTDDSLPSPVASDPEDATIRSRRLIRKLRIQIFLGAGLGLLIAMSIGAAFLAVWFRRAADLWAKSEKLWEGIFEFVAALMIFIMGVTMLKMDRAKSKWRVKLQRAFEGQHVDGRTKTGKWVLFTLPFISVLREGIEGVVFVGGVSLGQPATSIPIAAIVGLISGISCGFIIYQFASRATLRIFLIIMTNFLLLIGAGLFSRATAAFETNAFNHIVGANIDDTGGTGPGSYRVQGNVWHLDCCSPASGQNWSIFNAIFGWDNNATIGSVLSYIFYWLAVIIALAYMKYTEGRIKLFGRGSAAYRRHIARRSSGDEKEDTEDSKDVMEGTGALLERIHTLPRS